MPERKQRERFLEIPIWRHDNGYWYADFRRYESGKRETLGTRDRSDAEQAIADRKRELEEYADQMEAREAEDWLLEDFAQEYLDWKAPRSSDSTWANHERALGYLLGYLRRQLPRRPKLSDVTARRLSGFIDERLNEVKASSVETEMSGVSSMLQLAHDWDLVSRNEARYASVPSPDEHSEPTYLEIEEAAKVLKAARAMEKHPPSRCYGNLHALLATFLLTGGRRMEVFGLERDDVDLQNGTVRFQPNEWRGLKNRWSKRTLKLWPHSFRTS